jgi:hypothetical protein
MARVCNKTSFQILRLIIQKTWGCNKWLPGEDTSLRPHKSSVGSHASLQDENSIYLPMVSTITAQMTPRPY